jgi:hypothetical protein
VVASPAFLHGASFSRSSSFSSDLAVEGGPLKGATDALEGLPLPVVEDAWLQLVLLEELRHGDLVHEVPSEDGNLLVGGELPTGLVRGTCSPGCRSCASVERVEFRWGPYISK